MELSMALELLVYIILPPLNKEEIRSVFITYYPQFELRAVQY